MCWYKPLMMADYESHRHPADDHSKISERNLKATWNHYEYHENKRKTMHANGTTQNRMKIDGKPCRPRETTCKRQGKTNNNEDTKAIPISIRGLILYSMKKKTIFEVLLLWSCIWPYFHRLFKRCFRWSLYFQHSIDFYKFSIIPLMKRLPCWLVPHFFSTQRKERKFGFN